MQKLPYCDILGVKVSVLSMVETVRFICNNIRKLSGQYICVSNVHTTVMSYDNDLFKEIQNGGVMALPDGCPLSLVSRMRGYKTAERVTGPDLMKEIFLLNGKYRHYFLGSTELTLQLLSDNLKREYPGIQIVGMYSPSFEIITDVQDQEIIQHINNANADFVWIGLGAPKQEQWMANHKNKVHGLMIGVGAGFDYYAGNIKRAPQWMQSCSLEWLYRLIQDPKRLFKRYIYTNSKFIWLIIKNAKKGMI